MCGRCFGREAANGLQYAGARQESLLPLFVCVGELQSARNSDHHRMIGPSDAPAFLTKNGNALDSEVNRGNLIKQQVITLACGSTNGFFAPGAQPEWWMWLLHWRGFDNNAIKMPVFAMMRKLADAGPRLADNLDRSLEALS